MVECVKNSDLQGGESDTTILSTANLKEKILGYLNLDIVAVLREFLERALKRQTHISYRNDARLTS